MTGGKANFRRNDQFQTKRLITVKVLTTGDS
jgi:hypothetical protein